MLPWLDRIARAADGAEDRALWQTIYKEVDESGGPYISGWLTQFFPYLDVDAQGTGSSSGTAPRSENPLLGQVGSPDGHVTTDMFSVGLSRVPFAWDYLGRALYMEFHAGFLGASQLPDSRAIRPRIGWAVIHASPGDG
jgi:hypothetical protein